jgi:hypothetical protein
MPFISSKVSVPMSETQREKMKEKLGKAIEIIPGKSEGWLMIEFADRCDLAFKGDRNTPAAFVEIKSFGEIPEDCLDQMTKKICDLYEQDLGIAADRVYVQYLEVSKWGWNRINF